MSGNKRTIVRLKDFVVEGRSPEDYEATYSESDLKKAVKDGTKHSVLMAPIFWLGRKMIQAELKVKKEGDEKVQDMHLALALLENPNEYYDGNLLKQAIITDLCINGNAFVEMSGRNAAGQGRPNALHYLPYHSVSVEGDSRRLVKWYRQGMRIISSNNMLHFRYSIDPANQREGISPLSIVLKEIFTDAEAAALSATVMLNQGFPGVVISAADPRTPMSEQAGQSIKEKLKSVMSGRKRGEPVVVSDPVNLATLKVNMEQLAVVKLRNISEERVCALLGVPPAIVGFGAGLQTTKVGATLKEMREQAFDDGVQPLIRQVLGTLNRGYMPAFSSDERLVHAETSPLLSHIKDRNREAIHQDLEAGVISLEEARSQLGYEGAPPKPEPTAPPPDPQPSDEE